MALGFTPVVPPLETWRDPRKYDREVCERRNEIKRLSRRRQAFRRIFSRFEKLDALFVGFILLARILRCTALV